MNENELPTNGYFQRYVVESLERLESTIDKVTEVQIDLDRRTLLLQERTRMRTAGFGLLGGLIPSLALLIYWLVEHA